MNKVETAIHLRFDVKASSLPDRYKEALLRSRDRRMTKDGVIVIKAQTYRTQAQNREDALKRLQEMIQETIVVQKPRKSTAPSRSSQRKRLDSKTKRGAIKALRSKVTESPD